MKVSETEIGKVIVDYLSSIGWDVYQEVKVSHGGRVADIVGVLNNRTWVIETKTTFNLAVMEQADSWRRHSHYVSIAVPDTKRSKKFGRPRSSIGRKFGSLICRERGIGLLYVSKEYGDWKIKTIEEAKLRRFNDRTASRKWFLRDNKGLRNALCVEQKSFALAGNADGKHWSTFKSTCRSVLQYVKSNQGCGLREVVNQIEHHYASDNSAYGSLIHWISIGKVDGLTVDTSKRPYRYYTNDYIGASRIRFKVALSKDKYKDI